jgi:hypothetical protein
MKRRVLLLLFIWTYGFAGAQSGAVRAYTNDLKQYGQEPVAFVSKALYRYDLLVFDDALHSAYEPFVFYKQLVHTPSIANRLDYIFLEVISIADQPLVDSFLQAETKDSTILMKAFRDDYSGFGLRYQTYLDLFSTVWEHNRLLPDSLRIRIIGVNPPIYWEALRTWKDYELFLSSLKGRDYAMYLEILEKMENFTKSKKGIFLTNTRHAYKQVRDSTGNLYKNTTTFFTQWHPGRAYSIRIHNVSLSIQSTRASAPGERKTAQGLERAVYKWIRMDNGRWDSAFAVNGNRPVAVPLKNTRFGKTGYVGNHMLNVAEGTSMYDAYDAVLFLAPLKDLHFSAQLSYTYTPQFKAELERRTRLLQGDRFDEFLKSSGASTFDEYYNKMTQYIPVSKNNLLAE